MWINLADCNSLADVVNVLRQTKAIKSVVLKHVKPSFKLARVCSD